jgi:CheY-like chemotaxis protein
MSFGDKRILLVEDNETEAMLMRLALRRNDITADVTIARDGEEALGTLFPSDGRSAAQPSVVFLDLNLPKLSGLEVLKRIRSEGSTHLLPVIILSSSAREEDVRSAYLLGANSYVKNHTNFNEFSDAVKLLGLYWLGLNEPTPINVLGSFRVA